MNPYYQSWIKNNALWWSQGEINDETFISSIQYLVKNEIIIVPQTSPTDSESQGIPSWIKNNALWWSQGEINDETFLQGITHLVKNGIININ